MCVIAHERVWAREKVCVGVRERVCGGEIV